MRRLSSWINSYLEYTQVSESPELFHFWTAVSTIAGALRRRVWVDMGHFEWTPNFYIILVAPAGIVSKSTTVNIGSSMLRELEGVHFGPDSGTWQAIGTSLEEAREAVMHDPGRVDSDLEEMSCITCTPGELGTFLDFKDRKLIDILTHLWDGQRVPFEHKTRTTGTMYIQNPWINIISATTPTWLRTNFPEEAIGGGFASRVIFVFGYKKRQLIAYPGLVGDKTERINLRRDLVHDLKDIGEMFGEVIIAPDAIRWGEDWYRQHWEERPIHMASERFDGYRARKQAHIHKLAIVLSAAESSKGIIEQHHLEYAAQIALATEQDMVKVFESIGVTPTANLMREIVNYIYTYQEQGAMVYAQALLRHCMQIMSMQEFTEAQEAAIRSGYIQITDQGSGKIVYRALVSPDQIGRNT